MFQTINGWTKAKMKKQVRKYNNGKLAFWGSNCKYEAPDGNRCAAGCFIPDDHDGLQFNGDVDSLLEAYADLQNGFPLEPYAMNELQKAHDEWRDKERQGLTVPNMRVVLAKWIDKNVKDGRP